MSGRSDDEPLLVEILDDSPAATTVHLQRRGRRWKEVVLLAVVVAGIAGVGLMGDGDEPEAAAHPTTTDRPSTTSTTTEHTQLTVRHIPAPTTTTSWPQVVHGTGPMLPTRTNTYVLTTSGSGYVSVLDVDTGDECTNDPAGSNAWSGNVFGELDGAGLIQTEEGWTRVDARCGVRTIEPAGDAWPTAFGRNTFWLYENTGAFLAEMSGFGRTGREVHVRADQGGVISTDSGLVIGAGGLMTLVDADTGARTDLGPGNPVAAVGNDLVFITCPLLDCRMSVMDVRDGRARRIDTDRATTFNAWSSGIISNDGRFVGIMATSDDGPLMRPTIIELRSGKTTHLPGDAFLGFSADGAWAFAVQNGQVIGSSIDGSTTWQLTRAANGASIFHVVDY
jgi:hypothetical protein